MGRSRKRPLDYEVGNATYGRLRMSWVPMRRSRMLSCSNWKVRRQFWLTCSSQMLGAPSILLTCRDGCLGFERNSARAFAVRVCISRGSRLKSLLKRSVRSNAINAEALALGR